MPCWDHRDSPVTKYVNKVNPRDELVYNLAMWNVLAYNELPSKTLLPKECYTILNNGIDGCFSAVRLGALTESLCTILTKSSNSMRCDAFISKWTGLHKWWVNHQKQDAKVKADKKLKDNRDRLRKLALSKLTDDELKALGISSGYSRG